jgi:high-affinity Fe2+/Pb2+ permease
MLFEHKLKIGNFSTPMSWNAVAAAIISLLIGFVLHLWFAKNRSVSLQRFLMRFGFISVFFMVASSIFVLASFVVPFLRR